MAQWYFSSGSNSPRVGPLDDNAAHAHAQQHPVDLCWRDGMPAWKPVGDAPERPRWNDGDFFGEMFARGADGEGSQ